ncbi:hypothetical protein FRC15_008730 [Serendipita sp. 397]|nr:hypothetical protein FRC15_008730 [Serendipita sp. 397]
MEGIELCLSYPSLPLPTFLPLFLQTERSSSCHNQPNHTLGSRILVDSVSPRLSITSYSKQGAAWGIPHGTIRMFLGKDLHKVDTGSVALIVFSVHSDLTWMQVASISVNILS